MGTKTLEVNAVCVADWEADHLREINPSDISKGFLGGITALVKEAGGITVTDGTVSAFEDIEGAEFWAPFRAEFREESGLEVPPVMRVKVTVEVEPLSPEESKALWEAHNTRFRLHRRAQDYASALHEEQEFYDGLKGVSKLQPHTLRWLVTTDEGAVIQVETRNKSDWCDDHTNRTMVVGAFAEIPWRDPAAQTAKVREAPHSNDGMGPRDREADHRMAVEVLGAYNDWTVVSIVRNGEKWEP